jgi:hypothetical protein
MVKTEFIVQCLDKQIESVEVHELKDKLDADYSHLVGIAVSDSHCSAEAILEQLKVKGIDILPEKFEIAHIMSSTNVEPNARFYTLFEPVETRGDDIVIRFSDPDWREAYNLQIHLLLTNQPENIKRVVLD